MSGQLPLGEVCRNASRAFNLKKPEAIFINTGDVFNGDFLHSDYSETRSMPGQAKKAILKDDILYSEIRPGNGRFAYVDFDAPDHVVSTKFMVIESFDRILPKYLYLILTSTSVQNEFKLIAESRSGTFPQITFDAIAHVPIPVPEIEEQERIIESYFGIHDKIALNRKLNETLEGMARALFQSWFVDFDPVKAKCAAKKVLASRHIPSPQTPLPGGEGLKGEGLHEEEHPYVTKACMAALAGKLRVAPGKPVLGTPTSPSASGKENADGDVGAPRRLPTSEEIDAAIAALEDLPAATTESLAKVAAHFPSDFQESELGLIPEGWECVALYDTAEFVNGAAFKADDFTKSENALPIIKIAELKQGISDQTKFTEKDVKERHRINNGDLLYSWSGSPGTSLEVFKWFGGEGWLNQHIFKINTSSKDQAVLVWLILKHLKPELIRIAENKQTTGLGHVTVADMKRIFVAWPDERVMKEFGNRVIPIYEQHSSRILENENLAKLRDTLLPKLLSGELKPIPTL